jgi:hypothetical protein
VTQAASTTSTGDYATWRLGVAAELQRQHGIAFDSTWPLLAAMNSLSRRGSKLLARIVSMIKLTPTTDWLPASWKRRWNERLANVRVLEEQLSRQRGRRPSGLKNTARPAVVPSAATCPHRRTTVPPAVFTQWEMKRMLGTVPDISSDYCRTPDRQTTNLWVGRSNRSGRANFIFKDKDLAERNFSSLTRAANWSRICRVFAAWRFARLSSS